MSQINTEIDNENNLSIKSFLFRLLLFWPWILLSLVLSILFAFLYIQSTAPLYEVSTSIVVKKEKSLIDMAMPLSISDNQTDIQNEIGVLQSWQITQRTIEKLNFGITYYSLNKFYKEEVYKESPFIVQFDSSNTQAFKTEFKLNIISDSTFKIICKHKEVHTYSINTIQIKGTLKDIDIENDYKVGEWIDLGFSKFKVIPQKQWYYCQENTKYSFVIEDINSLVERYHDFIVNENKNSSIIHIKYTGNNIAKTSAFLNMLTTVYLEKTVEKKLITSNNTIRFIENQLVDITDSLQFSEKQLQEFQSSQKVMNVDFHAQQVFSGLEALQNKKAELLIKLKYYEYLKNYLSTNSSGKDLVAPASMGIDEPMLNNLLAELVKDLGERAEMSLNIKKDNPYIASQDQKIASLRKTLTGNISNIINTTTMSIKETDERINTLSEQAGKLPKTQRQLFGYERKFKLNDALYTYLLTKLNEIQITKAALMPDNEVLDEASYRNSIKVSPKSKNAFLLAIFLGLGFPILLIYLFEYISDKIRDLNEIEKLSGFHSLGFVLRSNLNTNSVVFDFPNSLVAESFRSIRTNLQFVASINKRHTILVTSSTMDEGKSFISLNIAESMALNKKKTILVSFDLRKQLRQTILDLSNEIGLSNYLSGNEKLEDVILKTKNEYFDVILPGPVPPNPTELIASEETTLLFKTLKETYDYIIIDTPPIGMVSDALLLLSHSDVNIYTVRHNTTSRRQLEQLSSSLRKKEVKNFNVIVNDIYIPQKRYGHYGFSYGYNYGYGYGYYHQPEKKLPWAERIINRLFKS